MQFCNVNNLSRVPKPMKYNLISMHTILAEEKEVDS